MKQTILVLKFGYQFKIFCYLLKIENENMNIYGMQN